MASGFSPRTSSFTLATWPTAGIVVIPIFSNWPCGEKEEIKSVANSLASASHSCASVSVSAAGALQVHSN